VRALLLALSGHGTASAAPPDQPAPTIPVPPNVSTLPLPVLPMPADVPVNQLPAPIPPGLM